MEHKKHFPSEISETLQKEIGDKHVLEFINEVLEMLRKAFELNPSNPEKGSDDYLTKLFLDCEIEIKESKVILVITDSTISTYLNEDVDEGYVYCDIELRTEKVSRFLVSFYNQRQCSGNSKPFPVMRKFYIPFEIGSTFRDEVVRFITKIDLSNSIEGSRERSMKAIYSELRFVD